MRLGPFEFMDESRALLNFRPVVPGDCSLNLGRRRRIVANRIRHYLMAALVLTSASVTVGSSGWAR